MIADDNNGDLMAVRKDGSEVGYLAHGDIEVLAERDFDGEVRPLKMPRGRWPWTDGKKKPPA